MNVKCCICHELFIPSDDVSFTPCGHFFHFQCVLNWLERSKTCPQCRTKVTEKHVHRAYFNFANTDENEVDATVLTSKIDSLNFQILLKDKDLKICGEDNAMLKKQAAGLRAEVRKLEVEIDKHRSAIYAFKEQVKYLKQASSDYDAAKQEVIRLKKQIQQYQNIETLMNSSQDEVDKMLSENPDRTSLCTYVCVMKREMETNVQRRRELRDRIKKLESKNFMLKSERDKLLHHEAKCRQMEEDLAHCENEKKSLRKKLHELEVEINSEGKSSRDDIQRFIAESPAPERVKTLKQHEETYNISDSDSTPVEAMSPELKVKRRSPYPSLKNQGACGYSSLSQRSSRLRSPTSSLSIFSKKPRLSAPLKTGEESSDMHYDGFGGHSKIDRFPSPIFGMKTKVLKNNLMIMKPKGRKLTEGSTKKIDTFFGVVDLT